MKDILIDRIGLYCIDNDTIIRLYDEKCTDCPLYGTCDTVQQTVIDSLTDYDNRHSK